MPASAEPAGQLRKNASTGPIAPRANPGKPCCGPPRVETRAPQAAAPAVLVTSGSPAAENAVPIPGGSALVGTDKPVLAVDGEGPVRRQKISPFRMGDTAVTNSEFRRFADETGYQTEAERFGWSFVFWSQVPEQVGATQAVVGVEWWRRVDGAAWFAPDGPGSEDACLPDHPVVQVSWNDARAYAQWAGGRLPSEAEWEHAARGGLEDVRFPWGDAEPEEAGFTPCNIWQGQFPETNTAADGYVTTAPARSFEPNGFGLFNLVGNVWEWTADPFQIKSLKKDVRARLKAQKGYRLLKGGSFLCHRSYCYRYRIAARSGNSPDSTTTHQGFRVVWPE